MAVTEALRILIDADTRGAVRGIEAVGTATDKSLGKSQKTIDKWSRGLTTAGAGMVALGGAALLGLGKAAQASEEANLATVKLENTLTNMPKLAGENSKSFIDLAQSIQDKTAADADAIVEAEALLGTFQLTGDEIRKITPLVVDYSRKFGVDLPSAAVQVGKALDGNIGALKRVGISIDETAFAADRFGAVQAALRDQVGGFAEAEGKTFAGSLERMKNQLGDLAEGVGSGAVDAFSTMFGAVDKVTGALDKLSPGTQNAIGKFATFGSVALVAAGGLSFTVGQLLKMQQNFALASTAAQTLIGSLGGVGRVARITGGLLAVGLTAELINLERQRPSLQEIPRDLEDIITATREMNEAGAGSQEAIRNWTLEVGDLDDALDKILESSPGLAKSFLDAAEAAGIPAAKLAELRDRVEEHRAAAKDAAVANEEWNASLGESAGAATEAADALQEYLDTLSAMFDPLFGATDALMDNQQAQTAVKAAELELAAAQRDHGASSTEAAEAQQKLTEAQLSAGKSALDVKKATAELSAAVQEGTVSIADARAMLNTWVAQGLISQSTAAALASQFDSTAAAANRLGSTDPNVKVTETGGSRVQGTLSKVQQAAINAGRQRPNVRVSATDRASNILRQVQNLIFGIPTHRTFTFDARVTGLQELNRARALTGRQHGGPVLAHEAYVVGEQGPELLLMGNQSGTILPHGVSAPAMAVGGGMGGAGYVDNRVINITTGADPQQVVAALRRAGDMGLPITIRGRSL